MNSSACRSGGPLLCSPQDGPPLLTSRTTTLASVSTKKHKALHDMFGVPPCSQRCITVTAHCSLWTSTTTRALGTRTFVPSVMGMRNCPLRLLNKGALARRANFGAYFSKPELAAAKAMCGRLDPSGKPSLNTSRFPQLKWRSSCRSLKPSRLGQFTHISRSHKLGLPSPILMVQRLT